MSFSRLVRFVPKDEPHSIRLGEPVDPKVDVGLATRNGESVEVQVFSGTSALDPGTLMDEKATIGRLLSPLSKEEIGTIRCIGLNYKDHAREVKMDFPTEPVVFLKPATALADPYPSPTIIPRFTLSDDCADYESELVVIIGKTCKNVSPDKALDYVLGYTVANDVSSRKHQLSQSQWCFSKGFDGACPLGPTLVSPKLIPDFKSLHITGRKNGKVVQDSGLDDLIFGVPELISFVSQGTTLPPGTTIVTGTPKGVGLGINEYVKDGDEIAIEISPHIGTLITIYEAEK